MQSITQNMAHQPQPVQLTGSISARCLALRPKGWAGSVMALPSLSKFFNSITLFCGDGNA
jgi:hypothetical protein